MEPAQLGLARALRGSCVSEEEITADQIAEILGKLPPHRRATVLELLWKRFNMEARPDGCA